MLPTCSRVPCWLGVQDVNAHSTFTTQQTIVVFPAAVWYSYRQLGVQGRSNWTCCRSLVLPTCSRVPCWLNVKDVNAHITFTAHQAYFVYAALNCLSCLSGLLAALRSAWWAQQATSHSQHKVQAQTFCNGARSCAVQTGQHSS